MSRYSLRVLLPLVLLFSLASLTAAWASSGSDKSSGNSNTTDKSKDKDKGKDDGNSKGTTGPSDSDGGQGDSDSGKGNSDNGQGKSGDAPKLGASVGVKPSEGSVMMRSLDTGELEHVDGSQVIPVGAHVDARRGKVVLTTATDSKGGTQTGTFWGGIFKVAQGSSGYTDIVLIGHPKDCPSTGNASASRRKPPRRLWGSDDHGKYRTHGQNSVATVRGTVWVTIETCAGTWTRVSKGAVSVHNLHTDRTVTVRAGHSYLARRAG
jgi:hypothetical protein